MLAPKTPLLKEWAYAGFFFVMTGAIFSHVAVGDGAAERHLLLLAAGVARPVLPAQRGLVGEGFGVAHQRGRVGDQAGAAGVELGEQADPAQQVTGQMRD